MRELGDFTTYRNSVISLEEYITQKWTVVYVERQEHTNSEKNAQQ